MGYEGWLETRRIVSVAHLLFLVEFQVKQVSKPKTFEFCHLGVEQN